MKLAKSRQAGAVNTRKKLRLLPENVRHWIMQQENSSLLVEPARASTTARPTNYNPEANIEDARKEVSEHGKTYNLLEKWSSVGGRSPAQGLIPSNS